MPAKNIVKIDVKDGYYHIYNRGVEKRVIFKDPQDYKVFLNYLKEFLSFPPNHKELLKSFTFKGETFKGMPRQVKNYNKEITLLVFCLMPNHFHLIIRQNQKSSMKEFMQSLLTRYSMYFNKRHNRVGGLFQGAYKAVLVDNENYLLHLSRYIHLNPSEFSNNLVNAYSSYGDYLRLRKTSWVDTDLILSFFNQAKLPYLNKKNSYKDFVEKYKETISFLPDNLKIEE
jgi:putative transposase